MPKYRCWVDRDQEPEDGRDVTAARPGLAAEAFVREKNARDVEYPPETLVCVRDWTGTVLRFAVELRSEPVYTARAAK